MPPGEVTEPATVVLAAPRLVPWVTVVVAQACAEALAAPLVAVVSRQFFSGLAACRPSWPTAETWVTSWTELPGLQPVGIGPSQVNFNPSSQRPAGMPSTSLAGSPVPSAKVIRRGEEPLSGLLGLNVSQVGSPFSRYCRVSWTLVGFQASSCSDCGKIQL